MSVRKQGDWRSGWAGTMLPAWPCVLVVIAHPDDESFGPGTGVTEAADRAYGSGQFVVAGRHNQGRRAAGTIGRT